MHLLFQWVSQCFRFSDKLTVIVAKGVRFTVPLTAEGKGTTIVSHPSLYPHVELGTHFACRPCRHQFTLTNRGRRTQVMRPLSTYIHTTISSYSPCTYCLPVFHSSCRLSPGPQRGSPWWGTREQRWRKLQETTKMWLERYLQWNTNVDSHLVPHMPLVV